MIKNRFVYLAAVATLFSSQTFAIGYPESFAFETSMEAVGQILSSPALPSLDNEEKSISPLYGIVTMEGQDEQATVDTGETLYIENRGTVKGQIAGLTFNYSGKGDLGFFAITAWSKVNGDLTSTTTNFNATSDIRDISAESYVGVLGVTYRLVGDAKSTFAMGLFGGPALIKSKTSANIYNSQSITKVTVNPDITGYYLGLQFVIRLGNFRINPYMNVLGNPDSQCLKPEYSGDEYQVSQYNRCHNGENGVSTFALMGGSGINVGYGRFQFGLVQSAGSGRQTFKTTPLMFSLRIGL